MHRETREVSKAQLVCDAARRKADSTWDEYDLLCAYEEQDEETAEEVEEAHRQWNTAQREYHLAQQRLARAQAGAL